MAIPVAFVCMVGCETEHYNEVFSTIRKIADGEINTPGELRVTLTSLFIHVDAEIATRTAALIHFQTLHVLPVAILAAKICGKLRF